ncbi:MAG: TlpA disulfide reductase family protein [bacterium]
MLLFLLVPALFPARGNLDADTRLRAGKKIPAIPLLNTLTQEERRYLGLRRGFFSFREESFFSLDDIQADYIVLEFLNRYCVSCLAQAPLLNTLYQKISRDSSLQGRIKFLAVGAGNNKRETQRFRAEKKVPFPIIPDPEFEAYEALGNPGGTPYLLILRQSPEGVLLAKSHLGLIQNADTLFAELKELVSLDLASFQRKIQEHRHLEVVQARPRSIQLSWSEKEIRGKIQQAILHGDTKQRLSFQKKNLPEYQDIYIVDSLPLAGRKRWVAKVYTRPPLCDVCHPIYFLLIFNGQGVVTNFIPLHITKYDNLSITAADAENLEKRIVGRHLTKNYQFRPEYDSISGATMSISLIFDSLNKAGGLYRKLQQAGYLPD